MTERHFGHAECIALANDIVIRWCRAYSHAPRIWGVPRGGVPAAYLVYHQFASQGRQASLTNNPAEATLIIDDLVDSGRTRNRIAEQFPAGLFDSLYAKRKGDGWIKFPWEDTDDGGADDIAIRLLQFVGEDPKRGGLVETPARFAKAWRFWTKGYDEDPADLMKVFEDGGENYDQMVLVRDIPIYSHCEHHLAPIFGVAHVGYIPDGKICGLSKLNRLVDCFGRRLQVQERLTVQIADTLQELLQPKGAAVQLRCRHLCMESRGICQQGHTTITTALRGVFAEDPSAKEEFLTQCTR